MNKNLKPLFNQKLLYNNYRKIDIPQSKIETLNEKVFNLPCQNSSHVSNFSGSPVFGPNCFLDFFGTSFGMFFPFHNVKEKD